MNRSEQLILNDINQLKNGKAIGPDNVPADFLDPQEMQLYNRCLCFQK
jgi:hypothetical protein